MSKKVKVQITLPESTVAKIDQDIRDGYTNRSLWFERIVNLYFENKDSKNVAKKKKVIDLEI